MHVTPEQLRILRHMAAGPWRLHASRHVLHGRETTGYGTWRSDAGDSPYDTPFPAHLPRIVAPRHQTVARLHQRGWIAFAAPYTADGRKDRLHLTDAGHAALAQAEREHAALLTVDEVMAERREGFRHLEKERDAATTARQAALATVTDRIVAASHAGETVPADDPTLVALRAAEARLDRVLTRMAEIRALVSQNERTAAYRTVAQTIHARPAGGP